MFTESSLSHGRSFFFVCGCGKCLKDRQGKRKWEEVSGLLSACVECAEAGGEGEEAEAARDRLAELTDDGQCVWRGWEE
jgi:hypothetical protein